MKTRFLQFVFTDLQINTNDTLYYILKKVSRNCDRQVERKTFYSPFNRASVGPHIDESY